VQLIEDKIVPWNRCWTFVVLVTCYFANDHHGRQRDLLYEPLCIDVMSEFVETSIKDFFKLRTLYYK